MSQIDDLFGGDPEEWINGLPSYQRNRIVELRQRGESFEGVAAIWINASAENTFKFAASTPVGEKKEFLSNLKAEIRKFLCGNSRYKKERAGLFGSKGYGQMYVVSAIAVAIAPHLGVAAPVISPLVALVLASIGKITLNAWCDTQAE